MPFGIGPRGSDTLVVRHLPSCRFEVKAIDLGRKRYEGRENVGRQGRDLIDAEQREHDHPTGKTAQCGKVDMIIVEGKGDEIGPGGKSGQALAAPPPGLGIFQGE